MGHNASFTTVEDLAARIPDGISLAIPTDRNGPPMALLRALIRRQPKHLYLVNTPTSGLPSDLLIGAGCVDAVETSGISLNEYGPAPCFSRAVREGCVRIVDATCPAMMAQFQAGEKGVPFAALRGIVGSDLLKHRDDWTVMDNPFGNHDPIVLMKALNPDIAVLHAALADRAGNIWLGRRADLRTVVHAARRTFVTVEAMHDGDLIVDERYAAGTVPAIYIDGWALAPQGCWPCGFWSPDQPIDDAHMREYARLARTEDGLRRYLDTYVHDRRAVA